MKPAPLTEAHARVLIAALRGPLRPMQLRRSYYVELQTRMRFSAHLLSLLQKRGLMRRTGGGGPDNMQLTEDGRRLALALVALLHRLQPSTSFAEAA